MKKTITILKQYSRRELAEIWCNLNQYDWDNRLGEKPDGFDEMPNYDRKTTFSKHFHLKPYYDEIMARTSDFDRSRAWHLNVLGHSKLQFYHYWIFHRLCGLRDF